MRPVQPERLTASQAFVYKELGFKLSSPLGLVLPGDLGLGAGGFVTPDRDFRFMFFIETRPPTIDQQTVLGQLEADARNYLKRYSGIPEDERPKETMWRRSPTMGDIPIA